MSIRFFRIRFGLILILLAVFCSAGLFAQEEETYTDLRGRSATKEDYERALGFFPESQPKAATRGIRPIGPEPKKFTAVFDIYFEKDSDTIRPQYYVELQKLGAVLRDHPMVKIQIEGHTCNLGDEDYNQKLSIERAQNVKSYLVHNSGIDSNRLIVRGYGESRPIMDNNTIEGREKNRRVEFVRYLGGKAGN